MSGLRQSGYVPFLIGLLVVASVFSALSASAAQPPDDQTLTLEDLAQLDALLEEDAQTTGPIFDRQTVIDVSRWCSCCRWAS